MPVEIAQYIVELDPNNPQGPADSGEGDDHLTLLKAVLQQQFPNFEAAAVTLTVAGINALPTDIQTNADDIALINAALSDLTIDQIDGYDPDANVLHSLVDIGAGDGLTGGGAITGNVTINMGNPGTISTGSTNSVTASSHNHALSLPAASTTVAGVIETATDAEALAGSATNKALVPQNFGGQTNDSGNGALNFPGGVCVRWGSVSASGQGPHSASFVSAFPSACHMVVVGGATNAAITGESSVISNTASGFQFRQGGSATGITYIAVGT